MAAHRLVVARSIITMNPLRPRVGAVAVETKSGKIVDLGEPQELAATFPDAELVDLGDVVLAPGFIDAHSHPALSGMLCTKPSHWIAPYVGFPHYADVEAEFAKAHKEAEPGRALMFSGLDRALQGAPELTRQQLDEIFGSRPVAVLDNSGHEAYFNSATAELLGWPDLIAPPDPAGGRFGRAADGTCDGRAYELPAVLAVMNPIMQSAVEHPLLSAAQWYKLMAEHGVTATTEHTYSSSLKPVIEALGSMPDSPLRLSIYHMSTEADAGDVVEFSGPASMMKKVGVKLWADGSPWVGNVANSFAYADTDTVRNAGIPRGPGGEQMMNYSRAELDALIDTFVPAGWQLACHVNGDVGLDIVLDAFERSREVHGSAGRDHGWRVEHVGAGRGDQFARAAELGVNVSMAPFQFIYWGDLLDGELFDGTIGSQWERCGDAIKAGASVSFHNDGQVSPPIPLLNIQAAVTRRCLSGRLHGPEQAISLDDALRAHTIVAAEHVGRAEEIGSIEVGKLADFVELSEDPYEVDIRHLVEHVKVLGTWLSGRRIDMEAFVDEVTKVDPSMHREQAHAAAAKSRVC